MADNDAGSTDQIDKQKAEPQGLVAEQVQPTEPQGDGIDWKAEARKWEARAKKAPKPADDAAMVDEIARIGSELADVKAEADALKAEKQRGAAVAAAAKDAGVDAELLGAMAGDTPEQIAANAVLLKTKLAAMPIYPNAPDNGAGTAPAITKDQIMAIKNPAERVAQIAKYPELFK